MNRYLLFIHQPQVCHSIGAILIPSGFYELSVFRGDLLAMYVINRLKKLKFVAAILVAVFVVGASPEVSFADTVSVSGRLTYPDGSAVASQSIAIGSSDTGVNTSAVTDSNGYYTAAVPEGLYYSLTFERRLSSPVGNVPASFQGGAQSITVSGNTTVNMQLPAAHVVSFDVTDAVGNPLAGATVALSSGSSYGVTSTIDVSGTMPSFSTYLSWLGSGTSVTTDSQGRASIWAWDFPNSITSYVTYNSPAGFTVQTTQNFNPTTQSLVNVVVNLPDIVSLSGRLTYPDGSAVASQSIAIGSSDTGVNTSAVTDSNGYYTAAVPEGLYYSLTFERRLSSPVGNVPASFQGGAQSITVSGNTTVNMQLPAAHVVSFDVTDAVGNPLAGATVALSSGSSYGVTSTIDVSGTMPSFSTYLSWLGSGTSVTTDSQGRASIWAWDFPNSITSYVTYRANQGFTIQATKDFNPTTETLATLRFMSFAELASKGAAEGKLFLQSGSGTQLADVSADATDPALLSSDLIDLTGLLTFRLNSVTVGGQTTIAIGLPGTIAPEKVFKRIGGTLVDVTSLVSVSGQNVVLTLTDGQLGDEDGLVNGSILDPLIIAGARVVNQGGGGGGGGGGALPVTEVPIVSKPDEKPKEVVDPKAKALADAAKSKLAADKAAVTKLLKNVSKVTPKSFASLTGSQLALVPSATFKTLPKSLIAAITSAQARSLSSAQLKAMPVASVAFLKPSALAAIPVLAFKSLTVKQLAGLTKTQVKAITVKQKAGLSSSQLKAIKR